MLKRRLYSTVETMPKRRVVVDRELPDVLGSKRKGRLGFALFAATMAASLYGMAKYENANSPIVSSTLYTLRRSDLAREYLGDNIRFRSTMPWVTGSAGIAQAHVDFSYFASGSKGEARVHFEATRIPHEHRFQVIDWSITPVDGDKIDLINEDYHPYVPKANEEPGMTPRRK